MDWMKSEITVGLDRKKMYTVAEDSECHVSYYKDNATIVIR